MAYYGVRISGKDRRVDKTRDDVVREFANLHCDCDDENLDLSTVPRAFELPTENLDIIELLQAPAEEFDRERLLRCFKMDLLAVIGSLPYSTESTIASKYTDLLKVNPKKVLRALHYPSLEEFFFSSEMADEVKVRIEEDGVKRFHVHPTTQNHHLIESIMVTEQAIAEIQAHNEQTSELRMIAMRTNQTVLENRLIMVRMLVKCGCDEKFVHTGEIQKYYEEMTRRPLNGREWFRMFKKSRMISCFENFFYSDIYVEQTDKGMYVMMRRPLEEIEEEIFGRLDGREGIPVGEELRRKYSRRQVAGGEAPNPMTILRVLNPVDGSKIQGPKTLEDKIDVGRRNMNPQTNAAPDLEMCDNIPVTMPELMRMKKKMPQTKYNPKPVFNVEQPEAYDPKPRGLRPQMDKYELEVEYQKNEIPEEDLEEYLTSLQKTREALRRQAYSKTSHNRLY